MSLGALSFLSPWPLLGLLALPIIWYLLRSTPPSPSRQSFPPTKILKNIVQTETTATHSPWWLTLLRLLIATFVILALARPVLNNTSPLLNNAASDGPLILVIDNGWAAANHWKRRKTMLQRLLGEAQAKDQLVYLVPTAPDQQGTNLKSLGANEALSIIENLTPSPFSTDRVKALTNLEAALEKNLNSPSDPINGTLFWLTDGLSKNDGITIKANLKNLAQRGVSINIVDPKQDLLALGLSARLGQGGVLYANIETNKSSKPRNGHVLALSVRNEVLGRAPFQLQAGETKAETKIDLPLELRNQISKLTIEDTNSASSVHLIDQRSHWRRIGLISNESGQLAQPLLSPLYYINRALDPYAEIVKTDTPDVAKTIDIFTKRNVSVIVMADIGRLIGAPLLRLTDWVENGGVLVRFAGPHMEESQDKLLPTPLRQGGRRLGGALSWAKPQPLAQFDEKSPFAGLPIPEDVFVNRQLLADPSRLTDEVYIWARLKDSTPLVTAKREVNGWVVLIHVTANSEWSSLPLSGLFVDMLKRLTQLSVSPVATNTSKTDEQGQTAQDQTPDQQDPKRTNADDTSTLLAPYQIMDGFGQLQKPAPMTEPIAFQKLNAIDVSLAHPPGFYGPAGQSVALNLFPKAGPIQKMDISNLPGKHIPYQTNQATKLRGSLFMAAIIMLLLDSLIILWMRGGLSFTKTRSNVMPLLLGACFCTSLFYPTLSSQAQSQSKKQEQPLKKSDIKAALNTHLSYVITGNKKVDRISQQGLKGLSYVLNARTAVEPIEPFGIDITRDTLAFHPILYWPVGTYTKPLSEEVAQRINTYMKDGGMIIFDTQDQDSRVAGLQGRSTKPLEILLSKLDIPRLEPLQKGHVLTKSFYLLSQFPGRYQGGKLWVEASQKRNDNITKNTSQIDGVSTLLVTSNDLASAWAIDENLQALYPVIPGGRLQREMAYRVGVNIVMYALAGNYKADQVHIPALLERLGQ